MLYVVCHQCRCKILYLNFTLGHFAPCVLQAEARETIPRMLAELDLGRTEKCVRVNSVSSGLAEADLQVILQAEVLPPAIMLPKVEDTEEVRWVRSAYRTCGGLYFRTPCRDIHVKPLKSNSFAFVLLSSLPSHEVRGNHRESSKQSKQTFRLLSKKKTGKKKAGMDPCGRNSGTECYSWPPLKARMAFLPGISFRRLQGLCSCVSITPRVCAKNKYCNKK